MGSPAGNQRSVPSGERRSKGAREVFTARGETERRGLCDDDMYTTKSGDTWDVIAKEVYGSEYHADALMAANP